MVYVPAHRSLLHPRADERDELAPEEQPVIAIPQRTKCVPPRDSAHGHTPLPAADVLWHPRRFCSSRGHHSSWLARSRIAKIELVRVLLTLRNVISPPLKAPTAHGSPRPFQRERGRVRDSAYLEYASFRPLTSILSPAPGERRENRMRFRGHGRRFYQSSRDGSYCLLLKRPFHTGVC